MSQKAVAFKWHLLEDLPKDLLSLRKEDLKGLADIWREQSRRLRDSEALQSFNERLCREWAIETGVIEGLYSIDRGVTQLLIERGLDATLIPHGTTDKPASEIVPILRAQRDTLEGIFDFVAKRRKLSVSYIKELHASLTRHQATTEAVNGIGRLVDVPLVRGDWKRQPNNPSRPDGSIHEYCPPEHVAAEMDRLVELHLKHVEVGVSPEVEAAWLHHRFAQIHPFQDGNGRVARALASLVFLRSEWFPLVITRDTREEYIRGLETADGNDIRPLIDLFGRIQKAAFVKALSISEDALRQAEPIERVISSAAERIRERKITEYQQMQANALALARTLVGEAERNLRNVCERLSDELREVDRHYGVSISKSNSNNDFWFQKQIVETAKKLDYFADTRTYRAWVRMRIREERQTDIVISFQSLGTRFLGVMAASAFLQHRDISEDEQTTVEGPYLLSQEVFQFSYKEKESDLKLRFERWLKDVILVGLDTWRKQL